MIAKSRFALFFCVVIFLMKNGSMAWTASSLTKCTGIDHHGSRNGSGSRAEDCGQSEVTRRDIVRSLVSMSLIFQISQPSIAAPPMSVMMEELGYFAARDSKGEVVYVPARIQRESSQQAIELAKYMKKQNISMAGAYWCPHCRRQRELFGKEAWAMISYQECASQGYQHKNCPSQVSGYPTWLKGRRGEVIASGELPLAVLAEKVGFKGFDDSQEQSVPPMPGACGK